MDSLELLGLSATPHLRDTETLPQQLPNRAVYGVLLSRYQGEERHAQTVFPGMYAMQKLDLQSDLLKNGFLVSLGNYYISQLIQPRGQHNFSIMGHTVNIIGFVGHIVSFKTTHLCCGP